MSQQVVAAQGYETDLALLDKNLAVALAQKQVALDNGLAAAEAFVSGLATVAENLWESGMSIANSALWVGEYAGKSTALSNFATTLATPWAGYQASLASAVDSWWTGAETAFLGWTTDENAIATTFDTNVSAARTGHAQQVGAARETYVTAAAGAEQTLHNSLVAAEKSYLANLVLPSETHVKAVALAQRNNRVAKATAARDLIVGEAGGQTYDPDSNTAALAQAETDLKTALKTAADTYATAESNLRGTRFMAEAAANVIYVGTVGTAQVASVLASGSQDEILALAESAAEKTWALASAAIDTAQMGAIGQSFATALGSLSTAVGLPWAGFDAAKADATADKEENLADAEETLETAEAGANDAQAITLAEAAETLGNLLAGAKQTWEQAVAAAFATLKSGEAAARNGLAAANLYAPELPAAPNESLGLGPYAITSASVDEYFGAQVLALDPYWGYSELNGVTGGMFTTGTSDTSFGPTTSRLLGDRLTERTTRSTAPELGADVRTAEEQNVSQYNAVSSLVMAGANALYSGFKTSLPDLLDHYFRSPTKEPAMLNMATENPLAKAAANESTFAAIRTSLLDAVTPADAKQAQADARESLGDAPRLGPDARGTAGLSLISFVKTYQIPTDIITGAESPDRLREIMTKKAFEKGLDRLDGLGKKLRDLHAMSLVTEISYAAIQSNRGASSTALGRPTDIPSLQASIQEMSLPALQARLAAALTTSSYFADARIRVSLTDYQELAKVPYLVAELQNRYRIAEDEIRSEAHGIVRALQKLSDYPRILAKIERKYEANIDGAFGNPYSVETEPVWYTFTAATHAAWASSQEMGLQVHSILKYEIHAAYVLHKLGWSDPQLIAETRRAIWSRTNLSEEQIDVASAIGRNSINLMVIALSMQGASMVGKGAFGLLSESSQLNVASAFHYSQAPFALASGMGATSSGFHAIDAFARGNLGAGIDHSYNAGLNALFAGSLGAGALKAAPVRPAAARAITAVAVVEDSAGGMQFVIEVNGGAGVTERFVSQSIVPSSGMVAGARAAGATGVELATIGARVPGGSLPIFAGAHVTRAGTALPSIAYPIPKNYRMGTQFFPNSEGVPDLFIEYAGRIPVKKGYHDLYIHAHGDGSDLGRLTPGTALGEPIPVSDYIDILIELRLQGWKPGQPIRLISCKVGDPQLTRSAAQKLADYLQADVLAPTESIYLFKNGRYVITNMPQDDVYSFTRSTGTWRLYRPQPRGGTGQ